MGLIDKLQKLKSNRALSNLDLNNGDLVNDQILQALRELPEELQNDPTILEIQRKSQARISGLNQLVEFRSSSLSNSSGEEVGIPEIPNDLVIETNPQTSSKTTQQLHRTNHENLKEDEDNDSKNAEDAIDRNLDSESEVKSWKRKILKKIILTIWLVIVIVFLLIDEKYLLQKTVAIPSKGLKDLRLVDKPRADYSFRIYGPFKTSNRIPSNQTDENLLIVQPILSIYSNDSNDYIESKSFTKSWTIPIVNSEDFDSTAIVAKKITYKQSPLFSHFLHSEGVELKLRMTNNFTKDLAVKVVYNPVVINIKVGAVLAGIILLIFYTLLAWEIYQRTLVAVICSILALAVLTCCNNRPTLSEISSWMNMELLMLLFCMMILIAMFTETGIFDYMAVLAFELSAGKTWPMIYSLCFITCLASSFLDNVTTVLLLTPVAIRLCEVMHLDPVPVLMGIIVNANIGGSLTPIGDPVSIIICSDHYLQANNITFIKFVVHTIPGVILTVLQSCLYLRFVFRKSKSLHINEPSDISNLRREIRVWRKMANSMTLISKDARHVRETLLQKIHILKLTLKSKLQILDNSCDYVQTLEELKMKHPIKNKTLLIQASIALFFVLICFFVQSVLRLSSLPLGWMALLGVIGLLIATNRDEIEHLMQRIEWTTLLFFAAMFVMIECIERLGLFNWMGLLAEQLILSVGKSQQLLMAIFIILWLSALATTILDSFSVTVMMLKVVISLMTNGTLDLPIEPLVWALAFGPCLGGNGTLYGASANVISAGIAEQHGYKISFSRYLKIVFPMMLGQITIITGYLFVAHILFQWH